MFIWLINPFLLLTLAVFLGMVFGNIRFGKFSFSTSGSMFIGILLGWKVIGFLKTIEEESEFYSLAQNIIVNNIIDKEFSNFFLILFIASVGLLAGKDIGKVIKKYGLKFIILGFLVTFVGAVTTYGVSKVYLVENPYLYTGVYTGALTSSPGLAASLESASSRSLELINRYHQLSLSEKEKVLKLLGNSERSEVENIESLSGEQQKQIIKNAEVGVSTGYAMGYPFGVLIVILGMNFFPVIFKIDLEREKLMFSKEFREENERNHHRNTKKTYFDLNAYALVCIIGYFIGAIEVPLGFLGKISIGSTGGVLISSLALSYIGNVGLFIFNMDNHVLEVIRKFALAYYFSTVGLRFGYGVINSLKGPGVILVIASIVTGVMAMIVGFLVGRCIFKINWVMLSGAICGGMTSTPGLGAAIDVIGSDEPASGYGASYPFALLSMVIFSIMLNHVI